MARILEAERVAGKDRSADRYQRPTRNCDIVMKGGITSGVVYPLAVCEIAQTYRLKNIGGTSAGAIAAAAAAAAEFGRAQGGFEKLAELPGWLGDGTNLFDLFQPQASTRQLYKVLTAPIGHRSGRARKVIATTCWNFRGWMLLGAVPGLLVLGAGLLWGRGFTQGFGVGLAILLLALGALLGGFYGLYRTATRAIAANGFGLCSGMNDGSSRAAPLTTWLAAMIDDLAGKPPETREPLTFGDLWRGPDGTGKEPGEVGGAPFVRLEMITTSLTLGRPYRLPFKDYQWYFDPVEFRKRFPERIVKWMEDHPSPLSAEPARKRWEQLQRKLLEPLRPLPSARDLPVVVAARLSLSFPLLISAVPLHAVDWSRTENTDARKRWREWLKSHTGEWEHLSNDPLAWKQVPKPDQCPEAGICWFSDGGITSNFPVHFFDAPIPRWPTFAINLRRYHPDHPPTCDACDPDQAPCDQPASVWMPESNNAGIAEAWNPIDAKPGVRPLVVFARSIINTMQNWTDNTQLRVPGYRDRVVHICHTAKEGGMNLNMAACQIAALSERGQHAGKRLVERFQIPTPTAVALGWDNHRWVRYRTTAALIQDALSKFRSAYLQVPISDGDDTYPAPNERTYGQLLEAGREDAPSYQLGSQHPFALNATDQLIQMSGEWEHKGTFAQNAPRPQPELRIRPRS